MTGFTETEQEKTLRFLRRQSHKDEAAFFRWINRIPNQTDMSFVHPCGMSEAEVVFVRVTGWTFDEFIEETERLLPTIRNKK